MSLTLIRKETRHGDVGNEDLLVAAQEASELEFFNAVPDWARYTVDNFVAANNAAERESRLERGEEEWILVGTGEVNHLLSSIRCAYAVNRRYLRDVEIGEEQRRSESQNKKKRARDRKEAKRARDREIRTKMRGKGKGGGSK